MYRNEEVIEMKSVEKMSAQSGWDSDFTLKDQDGKEFRLSDHRGKKVVLSFHPLAWTSVCAGHMKSLEEHVDDFASRNAIAVGISVDSVPCKKARAGHLGISRTRLLSDFWPHGGVAERYGVFRAGEGTSERANIVIGEDGEVFFRTIYEIHTIPPIPELLEALGRKTRQPAS
jgi:peroxiredoxin